MVTVNFLQATDLCSERRLCFHRVTETIRCSSEWPFQPYLVFDVGDGLERRDNEYVSLFSHCLGGPRITVVFAHLYIQITVRTHPSVRWQRGRCG